MYRSPNIAVTRTKGSSIFKQEPDVSLALLTITCNHIIIVNVWNCISIKIKRTKNNKNEIGWKVKIMCMVYVVAHFTCYMNVSNKIGSIHSFALGSFLSRKCSIQSNAIDSMWQLFVDFVVSSFLYSFHLLLILRTKRKWKVPDSQNKELKPYWMCYNLQCWTST